MIASWSEDGTVEQLRRLNAQFIANHIANDAASHAMLLHPEFCHIGGDGRRVGREDYLKGWAKGFDAKCTPYWDTRDERISVFGQVALVYACNKFIDHSDGSEITGMAAYTDTYICQEGKWLCIQAQITRVAELHWPPDETIVSVYVDGQLRT